MQQFGTGSPLQYNKKELLNPKFIAGSLSIRRRVIRGSPRYNSCASFWIFLKGHRGVNA